MLPPLIGGHKAMMLSDVCLSVAYIEHKSRTERPRKTKIGTEGVAHMTRTPLSRSIKKGQRSVVKVRGQGAQPPAPI